MKETYEIIGKVRPTVEGDWNINKEYSELSIVYNTETNTSSISRCNVPKGISITNKKYWQKFGNNRIDADSIIILSYKDKNRSITAYTLTEAINSISIKDRRIGMFISFYEKPISDEGKYRWNLYQFNADNIDYWTDETSWNSIYYNETKFKGYFITEENLYNAVKNPKIGDYAFVGNTLGDALVYICNARFVWTKTNKKATDYLTIILQGNVTIGDNGNWFNNGEDTGIPAKGEKGDKPYFRFNANTGNVEYSFNHTDWEVLVNKEEITGAAATVTVGTVTTLDENSKAQVINSGTTNAAILNFKIPKGKTGDGLIIKGTYDTEEILKEKITSPKIGDNYAVGTATPYHLWCYTNVYSSSTGSTTPQWKDLGELTKDTTIITQSLGDKEDVVPSQALLNKQVKNVGLDEYEEFSEAKTYSAGDTVLYNNLLYTFTTDHVIGPWDESHVESASLNKSLLKKTNDINNNYKSELGILNIEKGAIYLDSGTFVDSKVRVRTNKIYGAYNIVLNNDYVLHGGCKFDKDGNYRGYYNNLSSSYEDNSGYVYLVFKKKNESEITDLDNIVVEYSINGNYAKFNEYKEYKESTNQQIDEIDEKFNNIQSDYLLTSENVNNSFKNKEVIFIADNISIRQNSGVQYINELTALNSDTFYLELKEFDDNIDNYFEIITAIGIPSDGTSNIFTSGIKTENNNLKFSFAKKVSKFRCYFNEDDIKKDFYLNGVLYKKNFLDASLIFDYAQNKFQNEINENFNSNVGNQKVLYVSKNTRGRYNTITEAINAAVDNNVIIVLPGEYDETLDLRTKSLSIIGTDKYKCIITRRTEDYGTPPIWMTNSVIENFTIRALRATDMPEDEIWETSAANTDSDAPNKVQGNYCIHLDTDGRGPDAIRTSIVRNCILISECNDCIGCGAYPDERIEIDSCYCINKNGYRGFDIHVNTNIGYDGLCNVILKNNIFLSYHLGCIQFVYYTENSTPPKSIIDATMINNRVLSKDGSDPLNIEGNASSYSFFIKNELSYGNSDVNMNN